MFKQILVTTDGSANARRATETAAKLAAICGAQLRILHVAPAFLSLDEVETAPMYGDLPKDVRDEMKKMHDTVAGLEFTAFGPVPAPQSAIDFIGSSLLEEAESNAKAHGCSNVSTVLAYGKAAERIIEEAEHAKADLIVLGSRGLGEVGGLVLGSVSHKVIQHATCPCLTVK
ncbi:MAG: universal stress protein [Alphaproteobacteria bacterium]|nr:universal stress protein [Alphaproteobacteria bacterium]